MTKLFGYMNRIRRQSLCYAVSNTQIHPPCFHCAVVLFQIRLSFMTVIIYEMMQQGHVDVQMGEAEDWEAQSSPPWYPELTPAIVINPLHISTRTDFILGISHQGLQAKRGVEIED